MFFLGLSVVVVAKSFSEIDLQKKYNSKNFWVRTASAQGKTDTDGSPVSIYSTSGAVTQYASLKEAIEKAKKADVIRITKGLSFVTQTIKVPSSLDELVIEGEGVDSIIAFKADSNFSSPDDRPWIVTSVPITLRSLSLVTPSFESTNGSGRVWFEDAFVSNGMFFKGTERFGQSPPAIFVLGGYHSVFSASASFTPKYAFTDPLMLGVSSVHYNPKNVMRDTPMKVWPFAKNGQTLGRSEVKKFTSDLNKIRSAGEFELPKEKVTREFVNFLAKMTPTEKEDAPFAFDNNTALSKMAYERMYRYLASKYQIKPVTNEGNEGQTSKILALVKDSLKKKQVLLASLLLQQANVGLGDARYAEYKKLQLEAVKALKSAHGCSFSIKSEKINDKDYHEQSVIYQPRAKLSSLYPALHIYDTTSGLCNVAVTVHSSNFQTKYSEQSVEVSTQMIETEESKARRGKALTEANEAAWKAAFQNISNASERSQKVWKNHEKYRTRVEERGSGTYLISYTGNANVPPTKFNSISSLPVKTGNSDYREQKTVKKTYFTYISHATNASVQIKDKNTVVVNMPKIAELKETKNGPCVASSVDGGIEISSATGSCGFISQGRSTALMNLVESSLVSYFTDIKLPQMTKELAKKFNSTDATDKADAMLTSMLYGAGIDPLGEKAVKEIFSQFDLKVPKKLEEYRAALIRGIEQGQVL